MASLTCLDTHILVAVPLDWTRDPFRPPDRSHRLADGATLLSADQTILAHVAAARWDAAQVRR